MGMRGEACIYTESEKGECERHKDRERAIETEGERERVRLVKG